MSDSADAVVVQRCSASIVIYSSDLSARQLSECLSIAAEAWDTIRRSPSWPRRIPKSGLRFKSRLGPEEYCNAHIADVFDVVAPVADEISALLHDREGFWGTLLLRADTTGWGTGVSVWEEQLEFAVRLGLSLGIEFSTSDNEEQ